MRYLQSWQKIIGILLKQNMEGISKLIYKFWITQLSNKWHCRLILLLEVCVNLKVELQFEKAMRLDEWYLKLVNHRVNFLLGLDSANNYLSKTNARSWSPTSHRYAHVLGARLMCTLCLRSSYYKQNPMRNYLLSRENTDDSCPFSISGRSSSLQTYAPAV